MSLGTVVEATDVPPLNPQFWTSLAMYYIQEGWFNYNISGFEGLSNTGALYSSWRPLPLACKGDKLDFTTAGQYHSDNSVTPIVTFGS